MLVQEELFAPQQPKRKSAIPTSIVLEEPELLLDGTWLFKWSGIGAKFYRVVLEGIEIARTGSPSYQFRLPSSLFVAPPIEIAVEDNLVASELNKPYYTISWSGNSDTTRYEIQELYTVWTTIYTINEIGEETYTVNTPILGDGETHQYRVIAFNSLGQQSASALNFTVTIVTCPEPPNVDVSYSSPNLTIA